MLCRAATPDPVLASFVTELQAAAGFTASPLYLQTSPEFFMKRLLAAGYGAMYQIGKAFRNEESGRRHNPEFTLLEWYRPGFSLQQLMDEVEQLMTVVLQRAVTVERYTYRQLFQVLAGIDPVTATNDEWQHCLSSADVQCSSQITLSARDYADLVLTHIIEAAMPVACFVYNYPADQAALARIRPDDPPVAERFELYIQGVELANGFYELTDAAEQRDRFVQENQQRQKAGLDEMPLDEKFLAALQHGMPDCSGVALGLDRLLMIALQKQSIDEVIAFPLCRI